MTGLDPTRHVIVEIASLVTDDELNIVAEGPDLVIATTPEKIAAIEEPVTSMHTKSGLLAAVAASVTSLEEAGAATLAFVRAQVPEAGTVPLCGNSIDTDRRFLAAYLPELEAHFHYRSVDVSSIKELCRRWYPEQFGDAPKKVCGHRALDDIRESVAELAYYRRAIFCPPSRGATPPAASGGV